MNNQLTEKAQKNQGGNIKSIFGQGLRRTLFLWFLTLSLMPLTLVSIFSYFNAYNSLKKNAEGALRSVLTVKAAYIQFYFSEMLTDLRHQSEAIPNVKFLENIIRAFKESAKPLDNFVKSFKWSEIVDEGGADFKNYLSIYDYRDILLIDAKGNILFSVADEDDLGTNIFNGKYSDTLFAGACRKTLATGQAAFSDFEFYAPSNNAVAGFLVSVIINEDGEKIGLLAYQIQTNQINPIMQQSSGLGKTAETYLVGADLKMRSDSVLSGKETILKELVETEQTRLWQKEHTNKSAGSNIKELSAIIYDGPHGARVLGIHSNLQIADVSLALIAEIEEDEAFAPVNQLRNTVILLLIATALIVLLVAIRLSKRIVVPIMELSSGAGLVSAGHFDHEIIVRAKNEIGELAQSFNSMLNNLRQKTADNELQNWFKTGQAELNDRMRSEQDIAALSRIIITFLAEYLNARIGTLYLAEDNNQLRLTGSYAFKKRKNLANEFRFGEGLVGQAALEKESILLTNVPSDYITISSGLGEAAPHNIVVIPFLHNGAVKGVIELGTFQELTEIELDFLNQITENIAIAINSTQSRQQVKGLLEEARDKTEQLQTQQEELRTTNEELEEQTKALQESETRLQAQQEELQQTNEELEEQTTALKESETRLQAQQEDLQQTNEELEEQTKLLEEQKQNTQQKNIELEKTRVLIEEKAKDLETTSKYKSEFLANMSHELRTPLNSILLLSKLLSDNKGKNLTEKQVEFSRTVYSSGSDLLNLINDVLDLSKVEAGRMEVNIEDVNISSFAEDMKRNFQQVAQEKNLDLSIVLADDLPQHISADQSKVEQIVKNFISNSFKFTSQGSVTLNINRADDQVDLSKSGLDPKKAISFSVSDTGIGIPGDKQKLIFEAFQQADGTTSRKYGGTGLGLAISREMAKIIGGEIQLNSEPGQGSTFTLFIPEKLDNEKIETRTFIEKLPPITPVIKPNEQTTQPEMPLTSEPLGTATDFENIDDDRRSLSPGDKSLLIIEDDPKFLEILRNLSREKGFKVLLAGDGETGLHFADYYKPGAIILDIGLPGIDGWTVMARLKDNPETRHIPVHFISASDNTLEAMKMGGIGYLTKPVNMENLNDVFEKLEKLISKSMKNLLLVEDDEIQRAAITELLGNGDIQITAASNAQEAYSRLGSGNFDCMILDLGLPDMSGVELLKIIRNDENLIYLPIVVYTGKELTKEEKIIIDQYAEKIIIKDARSPEKLLDETALFLHRVEANLPEDKQKMIRLIHDKESILHSKKILLVDDDMRNVFALTNILEEKGVKVLVGKNGKEGLEQLNKNPDIALVLMDLMMPEMDGYEAMQEIRKQGRFKKTPIIALTAKAMKGDRSKCIQAGANDYLAKPVDADKLFSMLRVWLY